MDRKKFVKKGILGIGSVVALPSLLASCKKENTTIDPVACTASPAETDGPYPNKTPADYVRENIIGDRVGVALRVNIKVEDAGNNCAPLPGVHVDVWQCDAKGNYSEYSGQLDGDFSSQNFLRGRQLTDSNGMVSFITVYPGWYPGRAPHIHLEVKSTSNTSLLITQIAFPEAVSTSVYATPHYNGDFDTPNATDGEFSDSLNRNMIDSMTGDVTNGYTIDKTVKVNA